jgi:hypothetical protein
MKTKAEIIKLLERCDKFLLGDASNIPAFPFHEEKNTGELTILGVRSVLKWVLGNDKGIKPPDTTYEDFRVEDKRK